ncbi:MAG TPA: hypothetical protein H9815_18035 [Candidatus Ruania gallistercoris]|uniref:DUF6440 domain-containing protein n=1 Tax=Candidatus Ruania gallistercoris TaxID=2838746 RepID=A0A9D2EHX3_9MICO|nr:hypothetical protein [Candidatus Ruania gallistercoris]
MTQQERRFDVVHEEKQTGEVIRVLRDTTTGVCYLYAWTMSGGGLTALLNPDGTPVVQSD